MIAEINVRGWQAAFRDIIPEEFLDEMEPEEREPFVDQMVEGDPYHVAVAEDDGKVVGYVMLGQPISEALDSSAAHELYSLYRHIVIAL